MVTALAALFTAFLQGTFTHIVNSVMFSTLESSIEVAVKMTFHDILLSKVYFLFWFDLKMVDSCTIILVFTDTPEVIWMEERGFGAHADSIRIKHGSRSRIFFFNLKLF